MATIKRTETSNVTWKEVLEIINSGKATEKLKPGTEITETLKDGSRAVIAVAAVDLYQNGEVIFCFRNTVGEDHRMNKEWTNKGGWKDCKMREYLNSEILALLPDELVEMLSPKKTIQIQNGSTLECEDLLFLPSEYVVLVRTGGWHLRAPATPPTSAMSATTALPATAAHPARLA